MKNITKENGITLIALLVIIVILIIIASVSINVGMETLESTKLQGFHTELETIQRKVDEVAVTNKEYNKLGRALSSSEKSNLTGILKDEGSELGLSGEISNFRYFTIAKLEEELGLSDMKYNVFIHFPTRTIIAETGIEIDGRWYHILRSNTFYVTTDSEAASIKLEIKITKQEINSTVGGNTLNGNTLNTNTTSNIYKIKVTPKDAAGNLITKGILKYKESTNNYWQTVEDGFEFIIAYTSTPYDVVFEVSRSDIAKAKITKGSNGSLTVTQITD